MTGKANVEDERMRRDKTERSIHCGSYWKDSGNVTMACFVVVPEEKMKNKKNERENAMEGNELRLAGEGTNRWPNQRRRGFEKDTGAQTKPPAQARASIGQSAWFAGREQQETEPLVDIKYLPGAGLEEALVDYKSNRGGHLPPLVAFSGCQTALKLSAQLAKLQGTFLPSPSLFPRPENFITPNLSGWLPRLHRRQPPSRNDSTAGPPISGYNYPELRLDSNFKMFAGYVQYRILEEARSRK
ncbi:hypothetical protein BDBG_02107 [Blastomyces gilchristii SLH14081]|uniref:Uncharacterized protein n=1 Tax=Blastomyces gilchristii (strain SLH14081) TaxID=559298 RepID=A0A179UCS4_BLAGS|nr:uncharacterized protein BDBG_02107 [Blastomyces gilchristii SLH14081]OAT05774.1 hypothetical protein BDBG_02107 [Blastomyces gilchristii SLH14081]